MDFNVLVAHAGSSLTPNTKSSPGLRINSLPKWFQAWNQFLFTNAVFHPDAVPALLIYQATTLTIVVYYDAAVRTRIANNPDMHWDEQFPDEFNSFLGREKNRTAAAALCFICNHPGHFAASCSLRSPYPDRFYPPLPPTLNFPRRYREASPLQYSPFLVPLPIFVPKCKKLQFCGQYNKYGRCSDGCHPATHKCNRPGCGGSHPGRTCPSLSLTNFQDTNTSSQLFKILPHVSDKFNQLIVPLPSKPTTPVNVITLEQELTGYPDLNMVNYLLRDSGQDMKVWISLS